MEVNPDIYIEKIKEFEEGINRAHTARVQNFRISPKFVTVDLYLIPKPIDNGDKMPMSIYEDCKYIRKELDDGSIFERQFKSRENEF